MSLIDKFKLTATDASLSQEGKQGIAYASLFVVSATVPIKGNSSTNLENK